MSPLLAVLAIVLNTFTAINKAETELAHQTGATKKQEVLTGVIAGAEATFGSLFGNAGQAAVTTAIGGIIDGVVGVSNILGLFKHKPIPPPTPAPTPEPTA